MHNNHRVFVLPIVSAFLALVSGYILLAQSATPIYVDADATGLGDGSSWDDAYTDLQRALSVAVSGDEIWVAEGVGQIEDAITSTFVLTDGVALYGGFDPGSGGWVTSCGSDFGGNIDADPRFVRDPDPGADGQWDGVDDDYGDLHLQSGSPAIDTGTNATLHYDCPTMDLDGNPL